MVDLLQPTIGFFRNRWNITDDYTKVTPLFSVEAEFPSLAPFYFSWERNFNAVNALVVSRTVPWLAFWAVPLYLLMVFIGPRLMASRQPFNLIKPLRYWNFTLAVLSFWGMLRVVPHIFLLASKSGFGQSLCVRTVWSFGSGAAGFWAVFFVYSKYLELIDTVFIILRKRKLTFLHWYHHATVLFFTWDAFLIEQPLGVYFCAVNYSVHAMMYFYYYLASVMEKPPKWGLIVTFLQISQMFYGVGVTGLAFYYSYTYPLLWNSNAENALKPFEIPGCYLERRNLIGSMAMYSTYCYLFASFFWKRYISKATITKKAKEN